MLRHKILAFFSFFSFLILFCMLSSCRRPQIWLLEGLVLGKNARYYPEIDGSNTKLDNRSRKPKVEVRLTKGDYETLLRVDTFMAGDTLENAKENTQELFKHEFNGILVGNDLEQEKVICVEIRLEFSNYYPEYLKMGCVYADAFGDQPNNPTLP